MVGIGGVGGSGTRVVAEVLKKIGFFIGNDLNEPNDNLLFTLLFKRENILVLTDDEFLKLWTIFKKIMNQKDNLIDSEHSILKKLASEDRTLHKKEWLKKRLLKLSFDDNMNKLIGFKEPNSHIVIERIFNIDSELKYIYVYRNGLDMAYSSNQNQLNLWGSIFFNNKQINNTPKNSLKYWCMAHERMLKLKSKYTENIYMLDFDELCKNKEDTISELMQFLNLDYDVKLFNGIIKMPKSIDRYKDFPLSNFDKEDLDYVKKIYNKKEII